MEARMIPLFSQKTMDFLTENRMRDDKEWFNAHRAIYEEHVVAPLVYLAKTLAPVLSEIDGQLICSPKAGGSVSRVWRDARYSKDKSLFRDVMWCMFVRRKYMGLPEYFFVISPEYYLYGCGYYSAGAASMESIRRLIISGDEGFDAACSAYENQDVFLMEGDFYKKSRYPDHPERARNWLERKTICFTRTSSDFDPLYSDKLAGTVAEGYMALAPIYRFLIKAEEKLAET